MHLKEHFFALSLYLIVVTVPAVLYRFFTDNLTLPAFGSTLTLCGMVMFGIGFFAMCIDMDMFGSTRDWGSQILDANNQENRSVWASNADTRIIGHGLGFISNCVLAGGIATIGGLYLMGV